MGGTIPGQVVLSHTRKLGKHESVTQQATFLDGFSFLPLFLLVMGDELKKKFLLLIAIVHGVCHGNRMKLEHKLVLKKWNIAVINLTTGYYALDCL